MGRPRHSDADSPQLRQRILDISTELLNSGGIGALSMREVARRAGVTHQAPYHYFADRETILSELVTTGFSDLADRLSAANELFSSAGKRATQIAATKAYVGFAMDNPGIFRMMFRPDICDATRFPQALAAGHRAYGELERMVKLLHEDGNEMLLSSIHWAHVHGLACLILDGPLGQQLFIREARLTFLDELSEQFADLIFARDV